MSDWSEAVDDLDDVVFDTFGEPGTLTPPEGEALSVRAIVDRKTEILGQMGRVIDPTPSVSLLRSEVGEYPEGTLEVDGETFTLGIPVEGGGDATLVRVWLREGPA